jgi:hypothetical protein
MRISARRIKALISFSSCFSALSIRSWLNCFSSRRLRLRRSRGLRLVFGGIDLNLGAIKGHMAQAHHPRLLTQPQDLHKQLAQHVEVAAAELTDAAVVGLLVGRQHPKGQILMAGSLDLVPPARWPAAR